MTNYAAAATAPRTLTEAEQVTILRVTGEHRAGFRDHCIVSLALGAGLREHEIVALNVGDVTDDGTHVRRRLELRVFKGRGREGAPATQRAILSDAVRYKLEKFLTTLPGRLEYENETGGHFADRPLFVSRKGSRLSTRQVRELWVAWQRRAGFDRIYRFHDLRHTYCSNVYRVSGKDLRQAMELARHAKVETTVRYTHPTEDELVATARKVPS